MTEPHTKIIQEISNYLEKNPNQRFTQALFNLRINKALLGDLPSGEQINLGFKDNYNQADKETLEILLKQNNS